MKKKAIAEKIAQKTHTSSREILKNIEYYKIIFKEDMKAADPIAHELDLNKDEIDWMKK